MYDEDRSGYISREELSAVLTSVADDTFADADKHAGACTPPPTHLPSTHTPLTLTLTPRPADSLTDLFKRMDTDHDGRISFEEFKKGIETDPYLVRLFLEPASSLAAPAAASGGGGGGSSA